MLIKTLLNKAEPFKSFIFTTVALCMIKGSEALIIDIVPRKNSKPESPECNKRCKTHDLQPARLFEYVPALNLKWFFRYVPRRASCPDHGVLVEYMPWSFGKDRMTTSYQVYLAKWAKRLSWKYFRSFPHHEKVQ